MNAPALGNSVHGTHRCKAFPPLGVTTVVFDVVGTLIEPSPPVAEAYRQAAYRQGVLCDVGLVRQRFQSAWRTQESIDAAACPPFSTSGPREQERWRGIVREVFAEASGAEAIFADLWEHFGRVEAWRPLDRGRQLVRAALDAGLTVALASNFDDRLLGLAARMEPLSWVPHVFPSSEIGWRKPAPEFFRWIEQRLGCEPAETLLVGDDPTLDLAAAARAGWQACDVTRG
jgi:putative hydrolase of the HAD superfamily